MARHRRSQSVKTASFATPDSEPTPPGTADRESGEGHSLTSLRQSPPPVNDAKIPTGAVISPPDSTQNSSEDDEEPRRGPSRRLAKLEDLQQAIRSIEQHRGASALETAEEVAQVNVSLVMPAQDVDKIKPTIDHFEHMMLHPRISHARSNTDSAVFVDIRPQAETPLTGSDESEYNSEDETDRARSNKPPMLRKKSGELVRPALRPQSARRRPSSMPGTPTYSKAVHFDSHLEHVRHFLQVDRPLAVSAGSSPTEAYESEVDFPFADESNTGRSPPFEWEIVVSNFPAETPERLAQAVRVERIFLSADNKALVGSVAVANLAFNKVVIARFTLDYWKTTSEVVAEYNNDVRRKLANDGCDRFNFNIKLADQANLEAKTLFFCVKYCVNGTEYWDNNNSVNYQVDFRKKALPQNGKRGKQGAASRSAGQLPRSNKRSSPVSTSRPKTAPTYDDFADGFDANYAFGSYAHEDLLGDAPGSTIRLKGVRSAVSIADNNTRRAPNGQPFGNRYDFSASLSAAIQAANKALGDNSGLVMKSSSNGNGAAKKPDKVASNLISDARHEETASPSSAPIPAVSQATASARPANGSESPRPTGEQPPHTSQSYNDLLDKYCFVRSRKFNDPPVTEANPRL